MNCAEGANAQDNVEVVNCAERGEQLRLFRYELPVAVVVELEVLWREVRVGLGLGRAHVALHSDGAASKACNGQPREGLH